MDLKVLSFSFLKVKNISMALNIQIHADGSILELSMGLWLSPGLDKDTFPRSHQPLKI